MRTNQSRSKLAIFERKQTLKRSAMSINVEIAICNSPYFIYSTVVLFTMVSPQFSQVNCWFITQNNIHPAYAPRTPYAPPVSPRGKYRVTGTIPRHKLTPGDTRLATLGSWALNQPPAPANQPPHQRDTAMHRRVIPAAHGIARVPPRNTGGMAYCRAPPDNTGDAQYSGAPPANASGTPC